MNDLMKYVFNFGCFHLIGDDLALRPLARGRCRGVLMVRSHLRSILGGGERFFFVVGVWMEIEIPNRSAKLLAFGRYGDEWG